MRNRRFLLLSAVLVALNAALWLTPVGLAVRQITLPQVFGSSLMRAVVLESNGKQWRVDRGLVTSLTLSKITLKEADGRVQSIAISKSTTLVGPNGTLALAAITRGSRALVTWPASGAATNVKIEKLGTGGIGLPGLAGHSTTRDVSTHNISR